MPEFIESVIAIAIVSAMVSLIWIIARGIWRWNSRRPRYAVAVPVDETPMEMRSRTGQVAHRQTTAIDHLGEREPHIDRDIRFWPMALVFGGAVIYYWFQGKLTWPESFVVFSTGLFCGIWVIHQSGNRL